MKKAQSFYFLHILTYVFPLLLLFLFLFISFVLFNVQKAEANSKDYQVISPFTTSALWSDAGSYIYPNNYTNYVIKDSGNVGIGTNNPLGKLDITNGNSLVSILKQGSQIEMSRLHFLPKTRFSLKSDGLSFWDYNVNVHDEIDQNTRSAWRVAMGDNSGSFNAFILQATDRGATNWSRQYRTLLWMGNNGALGLGGVTNPTSVLDTMRGLSKVEILDGVSNLILSHNLSAQKSRLSHKADGLTLLDNNLDLSDAVDTPYKPSFRLALGDNGSEYSGLVVQANTAGSPWTAHEDILYLDGDGDLEIAGNKLRIKESKTPDSSNDTCDKGDISWDSNYIYVCTDANTWKRSALQTW
jgi:hypothetical protein